jgi:hypothetical protein
LLQPALGVIGLSHFRSPLLSLSLSLSAGLTLLSPALNM